MDSESHPFSFDWLVNPEMSIYTVVIAGVWQSSGFVMAMFLAGLRGIDDSIIKAAQVDGAGLGLLYPMITKPSGYCLKYAPSAECGPGPQPCAEFMPAGAFGAQGF